MRCTLRTLLLLLLATTTLCAQRSRNLHTLSSDLSVRQLSPGVWLHTWWQEVEGWGRFTSNGLIVVSNGEALLIDTPVNDTMTAQLLDWIARDLHTPVRRAILTHAHSDRMGGIGELKRRGIVSYAQPRTIEWAAEQGWQRPDSALAVEQRVAVGNRTVLAWFPGPGHAPDNMVVWLERERLLYGGCLVKAEDAESIGYVGDAVVVQWPQTIRRVSARFSKAKTVIPGHGVIGGRRALRRTLELLKETAQP